MTRFDDDFRRTLFETENARNLTPDELASSFVFTIDYERLLEAKNHVVLGSRGSGKTALARMLSHAHLTRVGSGRAAELVKSRRFVGTFVATGIEWVGALKNKPWQTTEEEGDLFRWRLNLTICAALLDTIGSCIAAYTDSPADAARLEAVLAGELASAWGVPPQPSPTLRGVMEAIEDIDDTYMRAIAKARRGVEGAGDLPTDLAFDSELLAPYKRGIALLRRHIAFPEDCTWALIIDEAEYLSVEQHKALNSCLRASPGRNVFKITTMPYRHRTLQTNIGDSLSESDDFEYVYIDRWRSTSTPRNLVQQREFARELFRRRLKLLEKNARVARTTLHRLLGPSLLLEPHKALTAAQFDELLSQYAHPQTLEKATRAREDRGEDAFSSQIRRKLAGMVLLRKAEESAGGQSLPDVYSGEELFVRCSDGNPRRLIRMFNLLMLSAHVERRSNASGYTYVLGALSRKKQSKLLIGFSNSVLERTRSEEDVGPWLHELLCSIGNFAHEALHHRPLRTDQYSSITIDSEIPDFVWTVVKRAVELGYLYPNVNPSNPNHLPADSGTFHLAYVLSPSFGLLPRRGSPARLVKILGGASPQTSRTRMLAHSQLSLPIPEDE